MTAPQPDPDAGSVVKGCVVGLALTLGGALLIGLCWRVLIWAAGL